MQDAILASQPTDWRRVAASVCGPVPGGRPVYYQKHMTHHMLPEFGRDWIGACTNVFLIRHPARVLASYAKKRSVVGLMDIGFVQQVELYDLAGRLGGRPPPVVDADDLLADPEGVLRKLCELIAIPFDAAMLSWPAGRRATDGVWAEHWYDSVNLSTRVMDPAPRPVIANPELKAVEGQALPLYRQMKEQAI
jgi:hypothetical protein